MAWGMIGFIVIVLELDIHLDQVLNTYYYLSSRQ